MLNERRDDVTVMDKYEVMMEKGESHMPPLSYLLKPFPKAPSKVQNHLLLSQQEERQGHVRGSATWLAEGIKIEEIQ